MERGREGKREKQSGHVGHEGLKSIHIPSPFTRLSSIHNQMHLSGLSLKCACKRASTRTNPFHGLSQIIFTDVHVLKETL